MAGSHLREPYADMQKQPLEQCNKLFFFDGTICGCFLQMSSLSPQCWCHLGGSSRGWRHRAARTGGTGGLLLFPSRWCCPVLHPGEAAWERLGVFLKAGLVGRCLLDQLILVRGKLSGTQRGFSVPLPQWLLGGLIKVTDL